MAIWKKIILTKYINAIKNLIRSLEKWRIKLLSRKNELIVFRIIKNRSLNRIIKYN